MIESSQNKKWWNSLVEWELWLDLRRKVGRMEVFSSYCLFFILACLSLSHHSLPASPSSLSYSLVLPPTLSYLLCSSPPAHTLPCTLPNLSHLSSFSPLLFPLLSANWLTAGSYRWGHSSWWSFQQGPTGNERERGRVTERDWGRERERGIDREREKGRVRTERVRGEKVVPVGHL